MAEHEELVAPNRVVLAHSDGLAEIDGQVLLEAARVLLDLLRDGRDAGPSVPLEQVELD